MNMLTKVKATAADVRDCVIKKAVPLSISACAAANALLMTVSAEESAGGVDISAVTDTMTSSLTDLVGKVAIACAGVVGVGLTIFGIKWVVKTVKSFFNKIAG